MVDQSLGDQSQFYLFLQQVDDFLPGPSEHFEVNGVNNHQQPTDEHHCQLPHTLPESKIGLPLIGQMKETIQHGLALKGQKGLRKVVVDIFICVVGKKQKIFSQDQDKEQS